MRSAYDPARPLCRTCPAVTGTVSNVGRECRRDAQAKEPPRQRGTGAVRRAEFSITIELVPHQARFARSMMRRSRSS
jgi:hypothetical protein